MTRFALLLALATLSGCRPEQPQPKPELTVAAAANLTDVFQHLAPRFEADTGIHPIFSFASTAQLTRQIENAAPFDVFAAADSAHVDQLIRDAKILPESRVIYARGR